MSIDHRDRDIPAILLTFADDAGRNLLRVGNVDRGSVVGASILSGRAVGESEECGSKQDLFSLEFLWSPEEYTRPRENVEPNREPVSQPIGDPKIRRQVRASR